MTDTHLTASTRFVEVGGTRFAYRRWGNGAASQPPMLFLQHFRGGMDHWDPLITSRRHTHLAPPGHRKKT